MSKLPGAHTVFVLALALGLAACAHGSPAHPCATSKEAGKAVWRVRLDADCRRHERVDLDSCDDVSPAVAILNQEKFFDLDARYDFKDPSNPGLRMMDGEMHTIEVQFGDGDSFSVIDANAREPHFVAAARAMVKAGLPVPQCWRRSFL